MRIRYPFAGAFFILVLFLGYIGLTPLQISAVNDKVLHLLGFFLLTITFYWALELPRRLLLKVVFFVITVILSVASELLQGFLDNGREFDLIDIVANFMGSVLALVLCSWYHGRMLERKRRRKLEGYGLVGTREGDLELGEGGGSAMETGVTDGERDDEDDGVEAWDEIGGSESAEGEGGKDPTSPARST